MTEKTQYPPLPKHLHTAGYLANSPPLYTAAQMKEFADATCAMRAGESETAAVAWPSDELLQEIVEAVYSFALRLEEGTRGAYRDEWELITRRITTAFKAEIKALLTQPAPQPAAVAESHLTGTQRSAFVNGWDQRGMAFELRGSIESDDRMRSLMDVFYPRVEVPIEPQEAAPTTQPAPHPAGPSDADLEEMMHKCGARWREGSFWRIEDADFHPALRSVLAKWGAAPTTQAPQLVEPAVSQGEIRQFRKANCANWYDGLPDHEDGDGPYETRVLYTQPQETALSQYPEIPDPFQFVANHIMKVNQGMTISMLADSLSIAYGHAKQLHEVAVDARAQQEAAPSQDAEDAARLNWLIEQRAYVVSDPETCQAYWLHWVRPDGSTWVQIEEYETPRAAIDAARAIEATHGIKPAHKEQSND